MSCPHLLDPAAVLRRRLLVARDDVAVARAGVSAAAGVPWVGAAADSYRATVEDQRSRLGRLLAALEALVAELGAPGPWPVSAVQLAAGGVCWGASGRALRVGAGTFVAVDPEALADAAGRLGRAAGSLDGVSAAMAQALWAQPWGRNPPATVAVTPRLADLMRGPLAPSRVASRLRDLAAAAKAAAQLQGDGETAAHRGLRVLAGRAPLLAAVVAWPGMVTGALRAEWRLGTTLLTSDDPARDVRRQAEQAWSDAMAAGGGEVAVRGVAGALTSVAPALLDPVPVTSAGLALLLARTGADVTLVARADPPQRPAPRGLAGVLDAVAGTYDDPQPSGTSGTPTATVTVERLDRPDGSRSWLVAVPGTQSWGFDQDVATDMGTNLELVGGVANPMTAGVLAAMGAAGIAPDEPVVLAGHSQGGMVALAAATAAAGSYRIGGVVTAGSPSVPGHTPAGVPVIRLEHDEDAVPQTDGAPTQAGGDVTRVTRSLADDHPVLPLEAHAVTGYVATAGLVDAAVAAAPGSSPGVAAVTRLLGPEGTTATTVQYRVERAAGR